eukprot:gene41330-51173_t
MGITEVEEPMNRGGGGSSSPQKVGPSDKVGKSLQLASLALKVAGAVDPSGAINTAQTVVDTAQSVNKGYRALSGKDKGKFCTNCGAEAGSVAHMSRANTADPSRMPTSGQNHTGGLDDAPLSAHEE